MPIFLLSTIIMSITVRSFRQQPTLNEGRDMTTQTTIRSDITGTVWKIVVQEGAALEADETIMVLESMKMEIPVLAPESGRLVKLLIAQGASVREGQEIAL